MSTPDETTTERLEARYTVTRNGDTSGKHDDCEFFVLDLRHDPIARRALMTYSAMARIEGFTELAHDLYALLDQIDTEANRMSTPDETTNPAVAFTEAEVEAAARAMYDTARGLMRFPSEWDGAPVDLQQTYRNMARAALAAVAQSHHDRAVAEVEGRRDPADFGGVVMPEMGEDERRLDEVWRSFGCASNPDAFKASVRERMWNQVRDFASESQNADRRLVAERDAALARATAALAEVGRLAGAVERVEGLVSRLELVSKQVREQGDVQQVVFDDDGVAPTLSLADELDIIALTLHIALTPATDEREGDR